ncbi:MAG: hypothetical protein JXQ91_17610 [Vannielia sp.]|uniref:hypothetical protein n=1 Tax=Vannielia sp. TaxID=2813045 RepID=UPI003B8CFCFF
MPATDMAPIVTRVLRTPAVWMIDFVLHGIVVNASNFEKVATALEAGSITAIHDTSAGADEAYYNSDENRYKLGFDTLHTILHIGLIVHESVHAIADIEKVQNKVRASEAAAYVAQALLIYYGAQAAADADPSKNPFADPIMQAAWEVSKPLRATSGQTLSTTQLKPLDDAIIAHDKYRTNKDSSVLSDGI